MATPDQDPATDQPPDWALEQAAGQLDPDADPGAVAARAWELAGEAEEAAGEQHDDYDPDRGGEA